MKKRFTSRLGLLLLVVSLVTPMVPAQQVTSSRITGTVTDSQGARVPNAQVVVKNEATSTEFKIRATDEGSWSIPSVPNGTYTVTISADGFKSTVIQNVKVDAGSVATVNATLEVGGATEQVIVTSGGSVIQSESANVSSTIVGRQIGELPWATRDAMQLVLTLPGVQTPGTPRTSSVNGLPKGSLNITLDGANIQDNFLKSSDGFFTSTQAKSDAVEEVTLSTATPGAESAGGGAVQIKFVTKSGSNEWHGGVFWQHRNTALNANYYFNNIDGLPRDFMILNQVGGRIGGPIIIPKLFNGRDKAFFFVNYEEFRLPQVYPSPTRTVLTDSAMQGIYTYRDSGGAIRQVNLYQLAATGRGGRTYPSTPDPVLFNALGLIREAASSGILSSRIGTNNDFNRLDLNFQDPGRNIRRFPTTRLDFNITNDHHVEFVHNYQHYFSDPDGVNGQLNVYPGAGIVVGTPGLTGSIYRNNFTFAMAERWTISDRIVNEIRLTSSGNGTSVFTREFSPGLFQLFGGFAPSNPFSSPFFSRSTQSRRNTPVKGLTDNLNWLKGSHAMNFGVQYTRVASFTQAVGRQTVPAINFGIAANDPINTGGTSIFIAANFPGATAAQRSEAAALYALLTGRISSTTMSASFSEKTRDFQPIPATERNHQNELGIYAQDSWKVRPNLTLTGGLRWEFAPSPLNDNLVYTRVGVGGIFGVSGVGNIFKPGVFEGENTTFRLLEENEKAYENHYRDFAPSLGFAWTPNLGNSLIGRIFGGQDRMVLRGGYSIAFVREGFNAFNSMFGSNEGVSVSLGTSPGTNPAEFGAPGSRLFRDGSFPFLPPQAPTFPFLARRGASINDFNPNLKPGYVQSWTFGLQRELTKDMALEIRYVGNHGTRMWRQYEIGEVNIIENGFLDEFLIASENLRIARQANPASNNFGNQGLPGQRPIPIIQTALATTNDINFATTISRGEAGRLAANIAQNVTRMNRLIDAGLVPFVTVPDPSNPTATINLSNFFVANPLSPTNSWIMDNAGDVNYHALQIDFRRRLSQGLLVQGSYVWSKSLTNMYVSSSAAALTPTTLRDFGYDKGPAPRDLRHAFKFDWIHELPVGRGKRFLNGDVPVLSKVLEGWQWGGVVRIQSGTPTLLASGRLTFNNRESGVVLNNITAKQLQDLVKIRKETVCDSSGECEGVVFYLPQSFIDNTLAAFEVGGFTLADLDPNAPYIGPPTTPGQLGSRIFLYGPWTSRFDLNLLKRTQITEGTNVEFRVQFLNAFNQSSITIRGPGTDASSFGGIDSSFGQTRNAYRDFTVSGTNDPGGRLIEFQLRFNF
ncbi:MAG TPA: TonB-dependent receptor [Blastocatellia bacterium]|nr:TonB-dependent receptor [Blastocatellia bacterium]